MVRRSHKRRKRFACGHLGFGRFCHRCSQSVDRTQNPVIADLAIYRAKKAARKAAKQQWQQSFAKDAIELRHLPKPIVIKTRQILNALAQGVAPGELKGRRFNFALLRRYRKGRTLLRISVSYRYRLLCRWQAEQIVPLQVMTHEAYNAIARNKRTPRLRKG